MKYHLMVVRVNLVALDGSESGRDRGQRESVRLDMGDPALRSG